MKNILISFLDLKKTENGHSLFSSLPDEFVAGGHHFFCRNISVSPRRKTKNSSLFDAEICIGIADAGWTQYMETITSNRLLAFYSYLDKSWQLDSLQQTAIALGLKNYRFPMFSGDLQLTEFEKGTKYVVKPEGCANGEMQFILDSDKMALRELVPALHQRNFKKIHEAGIQFSYGAAEQREMSPADHEEKHEQIFKEFENCSGDFFVMELLENVEAEYRVITDGNGEPFIAVKRAVVNTNAGFKQATAIYGDTPIEMKPGVPLDRAIRCSKEVTKLIRAMNTPFCGYDLFICKDGTFGFFEFGIGWGISNLPHGTLVNNVRQYYVQCANRALAHVEEVRRG